jgi:hypothetical protein
MMVPRTLSHVVSASAELGASTTPSERASGTAIATVNPNFRMSFFSGGLLP